MQIFSSWKISLLAEALPVKQCRIPAEYSYFPEILHTSHLSPLWLSLALHTASQTFYIFFYFSLLFTNFLHCFPLLPKYFSLIFKKTSSFSVFAGIMTCQLQTRCRPSNICWVSSCLHLIFQIIISFSSAEAQTYKEDLKTAAGEQNSATSKTLWWVFQTEWIPGTG